MLALILSLFLAQSGCLPQETSMVCFCRAGSLSACEALRQTQPQLADRLQRAAEQLMAARELEARAAMAAQVAEADTAPEPPDCRGQEHHIISKRIARQLEKHLTLAGLYKPRDPRFVAQAKDEESHCGYQHWHRDVDEEVIKWLLEHPKATPQQFEKLLREVYARPTLLKRFPNGF